MDSEGADLDALSTETDSLLEERKTLLGQAEQRRNLLNKIANGAGGEIRTFQPQPTPPEQREYDRSSEEYRSAWLKTLANNELTETEQRAWSTATASAGPLVPTQTANTIIEKVHQYAPLLDKVTLLRVPGIGVKSARLIVASRRFSKIGFYQLKKIGVVMKKAQYFITCCELPMRTVNELTPQGVRSLLLPKPNKKKVDERQLMLDFGE